MIPPDWEPWKARALQDALSAYAGDVLGISVLAVPVTAIAIGKRLAAVRDVKPAG
jgi:hypothetical protein